MPSSHAQPPPSLPSHLRTEQQSRTVAMLSGTAQPEDTQVGAGASETSSSAATSAATSSATSSTAAAPPTSAAATEPIPAGSSTTTVTIRTTTTQSTALLKNMCTKPLPSWYPHYRGRPLYHGNREALAWALDGIGRSVSFIGSGAFLGTALLRIATEAAGCETEIPEGENKIPECHGTVYGIKPSSLLTTYTMVIGVTSATLLPLIGAIVDYTDHRLLVGRVTSIIFCLLLIPQIFISEDTWLAVAILQVVLSLVGWMQTSITYAYLPELSPDDEMRMNDYTKNFTVTSFSAMVVYLGAVIAGVAIAGYGDNDVVTAMVGMIVAFIVNVILLSAAWGPLFQPRPTLHVLEPGKSIWTAGFVEIGNTMSHIVKNQRALRWFYLAIAWSDSAIQALATVAITYMTDKLQFTGQENGVAILCMLLGSVPGGFVSNKVTTRTDPFRSSIAALCLLITVTLLVGAFLSGPEQQNETYLLAFFWGVGTGWKWTCDRLVASSIIPPGRDAEMMGFFLFSGQVLSWIPPLVFTAMNEAGVSQQISVATLAVYFCLSLLSYLLAGKYETARQEVNKDSAFASASVVALPKHGIQLKPSSGADTTAAAAVATLASQTKPSEI